ncbi:hypothetical protein G4B88_028841 [Cannabis sativa]|uniref:RNase H type-1 domain-containing protein n=1 Tax=Cannabis sativa TaxID=3483 RepID=A0A7J6DN04_CANSA|nr:hypothetical protein G4B88_028841 [Cannabis sativa]
MPNTLDITMDDLLDRANNLRVKDDEGWEINEDREAEVGNSCLMGRFCTTKNLNRALIRTILGRVWGLAKVDWGVKIKKVTTEASFLIFSFKNEINLVPTITNRNSQKLQVTSSNPLLSYDFENLTRRINDQNTGINGGEDRGSGSKKRADFEAFLNREANTNLSLGKRVHWEEGGTQQGLGLNLNFNEMGEEWREAPISIGTEDELGNSGSKRDKRRKIIPKRTRKGTINANPPSLSNITDMETTKELTGKRKAPGDISTKEQKTKKEKERLSWQAPPPGTFSLNCDAALKMDYEGFAIAAVIRNEKGNLIAATVCFYPGYTTVLMAECLALKMGIKLVQDTDSKPFIANSDNITVVRQINSKKAPRADWVRAAFS